MRDFFFQIVLFLVGAFIGIAGTIFGKEIQKWVAGLLGVLIIAVASAWGGYEWGVSKCTSTAVAGITPDIPTSTTEPADTPTSEPTDTPTPRGIPTLITRPTIQSLDTPMVPPADTPTICDSGLYYEENDKLSEACELLPGEIYVAYPDDIEDIYYFVLTQTTSVNVQVTNYQALDPSGQGGQLLIYEDSDTGVIAREIYLQGAGGVPNKYFPTGLRNLGSGKYYVRVYTYDGTFNPNQPYSLILTHEYSNLPILVEPERGYSTSELSVVFAWDWERTLAEDEFFDFRLMEAGRDSSIYTKMTKSQMQVLHKKTIQSGAWDSREYEWQVAIVSAYHEGDDLKIKEFLGISEKSKFEWK